MIDSRLGPYEIQAEIGRGGMAVVYRAYQGAVDRDVAIKVITRSLTTDEQAAQRFQREARLIARLEHPHILPVYDFDGRHDPPYIVMRYLDGGTLKEILSQGHLPLDEVAFLMRQVGTALDYAHRQGIVHRDIKPSNIMIDREGNAFVTDFGLARMVMGNAVSQEITAAGAIMGTPQYMSPEQIAGEANLDPRSDIYSLGVILFQMLTGRLPFNSENPATLFLQHMNAPIPSALESNRDLPPEMDDIIFRSLAKNPADRYETAAELARAVLNAAGAPTRSPAYLRQAAEDSIYLRQQQRPTPASESRATSEQNKSVTALYANAAEYAEIVEAHSGTEAARRAMNALWSEAADIITAQGGMVASHTDEAWLAIWGADTAREDDVERAIRAGLSLRAALRRLGAIVLGGDDEPLPLNIGIHTGMALLTPAEDSSSYTASGATISLANRLMQQAYGTLLITHTTYSQVRGVFDVAPDAPLRVRRSREAIPVYQIQSAKPRAFRLNTRGVEGVETHMVGRIAELTALQNAFLDAIEEGETQVVTIIGDAGLGKSRLLYEFTNWAELRPERYWVLRGRATPEMTQRPYALLRDLISFRFEIRDSDTPVTVREKLEKGVTRQIGPDDEMAHMLGHLVGFDLGDSPYIQPLQDDPQQLTNRARLLFQRWLARLCTTDDGVIMDLEDLHHADDPTLDLINEMVSLRDDLPLLIVGLARPELLERRPAWGSGQPFHTRLELRLLDRRDSRAFVRETLQKVERVPKALRDLLVSRAEGNPYYMEELVKMLIDDRVILKENEDTWRVAEERLGHLDVPPTLVGLLQARLDSLLYPEKLTLQRAAVVGRVFYDTALMALDDADETHVDNLSRILERLRGREFIFMRETSAFADSKEYIFDSAMLRDVLLNTLVRRQVETYATAAARWLIEAAGARVDEYHALIAAYFQQAGAGAEAAHHLRQAGEQALAISAFVQAREMLSQAMSLLPQPSDELPDLQIRLGETAYQLSDYPAAKAALRAAKGAASQRQVISARYWLSQVAVAEGNYERALAELEAALPLARDEGDKSALARVLYGLGDMHWRSGDFDQAQTYCQESLDLALAAGDTLGELNARNRLGAVAFSHGNNVLARQLLKENLARAQAVGSRDRAATALNNLAALSVTLGDLAAAQGYMRQALPIARETGQQSALAIYLSNLAEVALRQGDRDTARRDLAESMALSWRIGARPMTLLGVHIAGRLFLDDGDKARGLALIGLSRSHPAATSETLRNVRETLEQLEMDENNPEIKAQLDAGQSLDLGEIVGQLLQELNAN